MVIHVGPIYQIHNYRQESRQAGRDQQPSEAIIIVGTGQQEALQKHYKQLRRQPAVHRAVITDADKKQVEQEKVDRFVSRAQYRQIDLDKELDRQTNRRQYKEGEEQYDICKKDDTMIEEGEVLREAYIAERSQEILDSSIGMSSQSFDQASIQLFDQASSPGIQAALPSSPVMSAAQASGQSFDQASSPVIQTVQSVQASSPIIQAAQPSRRAAVVQPSSLSVTQFEAQPSSPVMQSAVLPSSPPIIRPNTFPSSPPIIRSNTFPSSPPAIPSSPVAIPSSTDLPYLHQVSNNLFNSPSHFGSDQEFDSRIIAIAEEVGFQSQQAQYKRDQAYTQLQAQEESQAV